MSQLYSIVRDYYATNPRRASGGRWALAGFHFQFFDSLLQFFRPITEGRAPAHAVFDLLGDLVSTDRGFCYVSQHKRTLRRTNYLDTLREFIVVEEFLSSKLECDRIKFNYQIVTAQLDHLDLATLPILANEADAERWAAIVNAGRFKGIVVQPDPWWELIKILWPKVESPFAVAAACAQHVFDAVAREPSNDDLEIDSKLLVRRLVQEYEANKSENSRWQSECPVLTPADVAVNPAQTGRVLTGQRPTLEDFRAGCFMPRPNYLTKIASALQGVLQPEQTTMRRKVPIIWISGGSGLGKSALLMASLERAMRVQDTNCLWLRGSPYALREALGKSRGESILVWVDDLYAPSWRDAAQWDEIGSLAYAQRTSLVIIASSPTEYMASFQRVSALGDIFDNVEVKVEPLSIEERVEYGRWYGNRVGREMRAVGVESNFVLASVRYQLQAHGDTSLEEFALRLWDRFDQLQIQEPVSVALAASQWGLLVPISLFSNAKQQDGLAKLTDDYLFLVRTEHTPDGMPLRRLGIHKVLAHELYQARFRPDELQERAIHLVNYWEALASEGRIGLLNWIANVTKKSVQLDVEVAHAFLVQLAQRLKISALTSVTLEQLGGWARCAASRGLIVDERRVALAWLIDLLSDHLTTKSDLRVRLQHQGILFLLCWELAPNGLASALHDAARRWLDIDSSYPAWNELWQKVWQLPTYASHRSSLLDMAQSWLLSNPAHIGWTFLFQRVFVDAPNTPWLLSIAEKCLPLMPPNSVEAAIMEKVLKLSPDPKRFEALWLGRLSRNTNQHIQTHALRQLRSAGLRPTVDSVRTIVEVSGDEVGAGFTLCLVLESLLGTELTTAETHDLLTTGMTWLDGHEDKPEWNYVWQRLLEVLPDGDERSELLTTGMTWLDGHEDKPEWSYVWQRLWAQRVNRSRRTELLERGNRWLIDNRNHPSAWAVARDLTRN